MSVVVERGLARCPRCVAVADYTFVESGPNYLRYEVHCVKCGEEYREVHTPVAPGFATVGDALVVIPPPVARSALEVHWRRAGAWLNDLRQTASRLISVRLNGIHR